MFPNPRKLHNLLRRIAITDIRKRSRDLLRFDEEMGRRDIVVSSIRSVGNLQEGSFAVARVRGAVDVCVADGVGGGGWVAGPKEEGGS